MICVLSTSNLICVVSAQVFFLRMGKKSRKVKAPDEAAQQQEALKALRSNNSLLPYLRLQWTLADKEEWWWIMDDSVAEIARQLESRHFCVLDGFLGTEACGRVQAEVEEVRTQHTWIHPPCFTC